VDVLRFLLTIGDMENVTQYDGERSLCAAARGGHMDMVRELLAHPGLGKAWVRCGWEFGPLHEAVMELHMPVVRLLLSEPRFATTRDLCEAMAVVRYAGPRCHVDEAPVIEALLVQCAEANGTNLREAYARYAKEVQRGFRSFYEVTAT